ncbi:NAD(P)/FAD-dependent oxidoreductase [Pseudalkalibacillus sp. A8]|uniref:NAD(P)/FAD-dependent oxidoreductase n=1 Tax=Pseudalkalibacillus sp. A8 TaxID=3382641 RepID=UPI0038B603A7
MHHTDSLWASTANQLKIRPSLEGEIETTVTIIGAGFTGLATAYYLRKAGISCVVLEKNMVGWGASGRNAGMVLTGYKNGIQKIEKRWGREVAKVFLEQSSLGIKKVREIVEKEGIDCSLNHCGSMKAAFKSKHLETLKKEQEFMWQAYQYELQLINPEQLSIELKSDFYQGGLVDPRSHSFHPLNYALGLADAVEDQDGKIYEQTEVASINKKRNKYIVQTDMGVVKSTHIVFATNGYTKNLNKKLTLSVMPMGSHIVVTEPLGKEVTEKLIPNNRMISDTKNFLYYFRRTPDERILFGGRVSFNEKQDSSLYKSLRENLLDVFPELYDRKIEFQWGGKVAFPLDFFPHVGTIKDTIHYALGYCGHGASTSTLFGEYVAKNIVHPNREKSKLEELPLKTIPFHNQRKLLLNIAGSYYSIMDKVN